MRTLSVPATSAATARVTAGSGGRRKAAVRIYGNLVRSVKAAVNWMRL